MLKLIIAAAALTAPVGPGPVAVEITRLEAQWGEAFVKRDFGLIERIVAPEFRLVVARPDGRFSVTRRAEWMKNARAFVSHAFAVETVDVSQVGDTIVASARGSWTVTRRAGEKPRPTQFFVTDTWVKRSGKWQVIHRYSHRLPEASWPPPGSAERRPVARPASN